MFIDELACNINLFQKKRISITQRDVIDSPKDYISLIVAATEEGIVEFKLKEGFYKNADFADFLKNCA